MAKEEGKQNLKRNEKEQNIIKNAEKAWEKLTLADNFIFCKVMRNRELCKRILSEILGEEIEIIDYPEYEKTIDIRCDAKSIRLDVHAKDDKNVVYNIEMQSTYKPFLPKRGRYYQDLIDLDLLEKGQYYQELNRSIVIFICTFDLYGYNRYLYTFRNRCEEVEGLEYGDETVKIIVNTKGAEGEVSKELKEFLSCINGEFTNSGLSVKLKMEVEKVKRSREYRREYMTLYVHEEDIRRESLKKGEKIGEEIKLIHQICKKLEKNKTPETIADELEEEINVVNDICEIAERMKPDYDAEKIYEMLHEGSGKLD